MIFPLSSCSSKMPSDDLQLFNQHKPELETVLKIVQNDYNQRNSIGTPDHPWQTYFLDFNDKTIYTYNPEESDNKQILAISNEESEEIICLEPYFKRGLDCIYIDDASVRFSSGEGSLCIIYQYNEKSPQYVFEEGDKYNYSVCKIDKNWYYATADKF